MPFTVEDGSGLLAANSYVNVASADDYAVDYGASDWLGDNTAKEQALVRATAWIDGNFGNLFPGKPVNGRSQSLLWPRSDAYDVNGELIDANSVPAEIQTATIEAAIRELVTPDSLSPDYVGSNRVKSEKIGELSVEYAVLGGADEIKPILNSVRNALSTIVDFGSTKLLDRA